MDRKYDNSERIGMLVSLVDSRSLQHSRAPRGHALTDALREAEEDVEVAIGPKVDEDTNAGEGAREDAGAVVADSVAGNAMDAPTNVREQRMRSQ